ncbi:MAG: M24 family metallopeptidase [Dehalococcoidia bacterium]
MAHQKNEGMMNERCKKGMSLKFPEFPQAEYERRLSEIQRHLQENQIDALLVTSKENFRYITGFYTERWLNLSRPRICWLPKEGQPILVVSDADETDARATSWIEDIRSYAGWAAEGPNIFDMPQIELNGAMQQTLIEAARSLSLDKGKRIGLELGGNMRWGLTLWAFRELQETLSAIDWVDAAGVLWECRLIKSNLEVEYTRQAVKALDGAFPALFQEVSRGMTEVDVARRLRRHIMDNGADSPGYVTVSADVSNALRGAPTTRKLSPGDMVYCDGGAFVSGYCADYCRFASVGEPSDTQKRAYKVLINALDAGLAAVRPGVKAGDVARRVNTAFEEGGAKIGKLGRHGHGIGLEQPEPPNIQLEDPTVLRPGMILCIEPNMYYPGVGYLVAEEEVVVTEDGCEVLSVRTPREPISL